VGPLLRYVGESEATVWVETDGACEVAVLGRRARSFQVAGHHYAIVVIEGLEPGSVREYEVALDGERRSPEPGSQFPPSVIRTLAREAETRVAFGSCSVTAPPQPPYSLPRRDDRRGLGIGALYALAHRLVREPPPRRPDLLLLLGDQVYADEVSPATQQFIRTRRDGPRPPGQQVANFEEYAPDARDRPRAGQERLRQNSVSLTHHFSRWRHDASRKPAPADTHSPIPVIHPLQMV